MHVLPPLQAGEGWGGVAHTRAIRRKRKQPPPNLPLQAGGGAYLE